MDWLGDLWTPATGLAGIGLAAVAGVLTGRLWPLRNVLMLLTPLREELVETKAENKALKERNAILERLTIEHLEGAQIGVRAMQAVKEIAEQRAQDATTQTMQLPTVPTPRGTSTVYRAAAR
jgi:hypothetical protein